MKEFVNGGCLEILRDFQLEKNFDQFKDSVEAGGCNRYSDFKSC